MHAEYLIPAKPWWQSKTLWLNVLGLLIVILGIILENAHLLALPERWVAYLTVGLAIANAVLRFFTYQPLSDGQKLLRFKTNRPDSMTLHRQA